MKKNKKLVAIIFISMIIVPIWGINRYNKYQKNNEEVISIHIDNDYRVTLAEDNCKITTQQNAATIQKYNGNATTIVIDKNIVESKKIEINSKAFLECTNLDRILIDKSLVSENLEIENFEINTNYQDEQYVEYRIVQEYSEAYKQYLELSEKDKSELEIIPSKYDVSLSNIYSNSMEENYNVTGINEEYIPESFDLRDVINIKVENQDATGTCYAYASLTAVETNLALIDNDYIDLSEVHMSCLADQALGKRW